MAALALIGAAVAFPDAAAQAGAGKPFTETGTASWYGSEHQHRRTASGERFDMHQFTAAHPWLPLGTFVRVTRLSNHRSVVVRINDRGVGYNGRIIDLSAQAARELGMFRQGVAPVRLEVLASRPAQNG